MYIVQCTIGKLNLKYVARAEIDFLARARSACKVNGVIEFKYTIVCFTSSCITNRAAVSLFWD